jgi:hypothetical protein
VPARPSAARDHAITLTGDGRGGIDTDSVNVTVQDTTPPTITLALSPSVLWPPNHQLVPVVATVNVHDSCDADPPSVELVSIVSNESANGRGDGSTSADVLDADIGADDRDFKLRAERSGLGLGRVYTVTYRSTDLAATGPAAPWFWSRTTGDGDSNC